MVPNYLTGFVCTGCEAKTDTPLKRLVCPECGGNLDARYDYGKAAAHMAPEQLSQSREPGIWRYASLFPTNLEHPPVTLPVGMTPLTPAPRLGDALGLEQVWIKNDTLNPSGSFKDRASLMVLAHASEQNITTICGASTGNAGTSMACLGAAAGMSPVIFVPCTIPRAKLAQLLVFGARVVPVNGDYTQAFELCERACRHTGWFNRNTGTNPYTREGKKTVAFEIWEQLGFRVPDAVVVPVGDGNIISGVYKGFYDLHQAQLIQRIPKIIGVQAEQSNAIARAFHTDGVIRRICADTRADSISASFPSDGPAALAGVRASGGTFETVSDAAIMAAVPLLAGTQGVFAEPSAAAGTAAVPPLVKSGRLLPSDEVVLLVTGSGLKDIDAAMDMVQIPEPVDPDLNIDRVLHRLEQH